ncbi:cell division protein CpoB, partial [Providencia stuartii]|uniref:YbgF trimerization domain-containing protein n=1 Tax=Providencia stuartii TaxID=588 RepID=UPI003327945A
DTLRGQIQENQYKLNQIVERQKDLYMQLGQVSGGTTESSNSSAPEASGGGEKEDYNAAVALAMKSKSKAQIDEAIGALQSFIK